MDTGADHTGDGGRAVARRDHRPVLQDGVPGHDFFACAGKPDAGVEIVRVRGERQLELRLHDDYRAECWNHHAYRAGDDLGRMLTADELERCRDTSSGCRPRATGRISHSPRRRGDRPAAASRSSAMGPAPRQPHLG